MYIHVAETLIAAALCHRSDHKAILNTVIWGKTGRVKNFKVILKIFRKCFLEFFFQKKIHN